MLCLMHNARGAHGTRGQVRIYQVKDDWWRYSKYVTLSALYNFNISICLTHVVWDTTCDGGFILILTWSWLKKHPLNIKLGSFTL